VCRFVLKGFTLSVYGEFLLSLAVYGTVPVLANISMVGTGVVNGGVDAKQPCKLFRVGEFFL
jgi:hypothetical protein